MAGLLLHNHQERLDIEEHSRRHWRALAKLRVYATDADSTVEALKARARVAEHALALQQVAEGESRQCSVLVDRVR